MDKTTKLKEAIKMSLAFALVYGIALKVNWLSPGWAGWSVVAIAATSGGGESLQKGFLRIWGTFLACTIGISIISIGAQNRWLFMFLTAAWLFYATYKMLANKEKSYFWFVAGYVTLVITAAGPSSSGGFYIAIFRSLETIMGIVVFTLIAVFLWPRTNIGSIKNAVCALLGTQTNLFQGLNEVLIENNPASKIKGLIQLQVKQLGQFKQSLKAEGSESYFVREQKSLWNQYEFLNNKLLKSIDRLLGGIEDLSDTHEQKYRSKINSFFSEMETRFAAMSSWFAGNSAHIDLQDIKIGISSMESTDLSHFDKAALAIIIVELNNIEAISRNMVEVAACLANDNIPECKALIRSSKSQNKSRFNFPVLDIEYLKASLYVSMSIIFGFIIWFYINPPGHSSWYIMGGVFTLIFAAAPQVKITKLIIPFIIAMVLVSLIYVLVLPGFTNFYQLGILLFACMFVIQYFLSGGATAIFTIVLIQLLAVNNPQTFDASALVNSFVFIPMLMFYLYGMSYIVNSPRPEKALLKLVSRFFMSAKYLTSAQLYDNKSASLIQQYKTAFYQYELQSLPAKMRKWGKAIDKKLFPDTNMEEIEEMVNTLEVFVVRMGTLLEAKTLSRENRLVELSTTISDWKQRLIIAFDNWDNLTEDGIIPNSSESLAKEMEELEEKLKEIISHDEDKINEEDGIQFYHLLGGYRGLVEATLSFTQVADKLSWREWQEERFQ